MRDITAAFQAIQFGYDHFTANAVLEISAGWPGSWGQKSSADGLLPAGLAVARIATKRGGRRDGLLGSRSAGLASEGNA